MLSITIKQPSNMSTWQEAVPEFRRVFLTAAVCFCLLWLVLDEDVSSIPVMKEVCRNWALRNAACVHVFVKRDPPRYCGPAHLSWRRSLKEAPNRTRL